MGELGPKGSYSDRMKDGEIRRRSEEKQKRSDARVKSGDQNFPYDAPSNFGPNSMKSPVNSLDYAKGGGVTRFKDDHCGHHDMKRGGSVKGKC